MTLPNDIQRRAPARLSARWLLAAGLTILAFGLIFVVTAFPVRAAAGI